MNIKQNLPKLKPYVAIRALLTIIIPTDVTTLNIHAAASTAAFFSALLAGAIFFIFLKLNCKVLYPSASTNKFIHIHKKSKSITRFREKNTLERKNGTNKIRNIARNEGYQNFNYKGDFDTKSQTIIEPYIQSSREKNHLILKMKLPIHEVHNTGINGY